MTETEQRSCEGCVHLHVCRMQLTDSGEFDTPEEIDAVLSTRCEHYLPETKLDVVDEWLLSIVREVGDESSAYQAVADESGRQWVVELSALRMPRTAAVLGEEDTHD